MNSIDLMLDEENELTFNVNIEGSRPATAKCRLSLAGENMSLVFESSKVDGDEISVILPPLHHVLKEGEHEMTLEVIVEDRYFAPLKVLGNFEKSIKITAESIKSDKKKKLNAAATLVTTKSRKKKKPLMVENKKKKVIKQNLSDNEILNIIKVLSKK